MKVNIGEKNPTIWRKIEKYKVIYFLTEFMKNLM